MKFTFGFAAMAGAVAALTFAVTVPSAHAALLTFEEFAHEQDLQGVGGVVNTKEFLIEFTNSNAADNGASFFIAGPSNRFNRRSAALVPNLCAMPIFIYPTDFSPITLKSIDLAGYGDIGSVGGSVTFEGMYSDGTLVKTSVKLGRNGAWKTVKFPETFKNLIFLRWGRTDCNGNQTHLFDNVRVLAGWQ